MIEKTLILIKPDGVKRGLIGDILKRFEQRGLKIIGMKMVQPTKTLAGKHYAESIAEKHGEQVRNYLIDYITVSPIIAIAVQGVHAIAVVRKIIGSTYPGEASVGTIRGDFAHLSKEYARKYNQGQNLVHASENEEDATKELGLWFTKEELHTYKRIDEDHIL